MDCPFCNLDTKSDKIISENEYSIAFYDNYPVSPGHNLIVPKQHVDSIFQLAPKEYLRVWAAVYDITSLLEDEFMPDGFTIGVNEGIMAGQTIPHAHIHIIPRFSGDVPDPRGGVRWVIPEKARYW